MKKVITLIVLLLFNAPYNLYAYNTSLYWSLTWFEKNIIKLWDKTCENYKDSDIPTIFIPWILASWYQEDWYEKNKIKRWLPDPITHVYDPLFFTFKRNWYTIKDVFYKDEFNVYIKWNPKSWFYLFGYDWKKDNKITATLLNNLSWLILKKYEEYNWCNIWQVNIIAHSMWWLVARSMLENMCVDLSKIRNTQSNWKIKDYKIISCDNPYSSYTIWKKIMVNKFITISTPNRWSPKSMLVWEKWDINKSDGFWAWNWLKAKLWLFFWSDKSLYDLVHWYNKKLAKWIVTIGQLLPDIQKTNFYNELLLYLEKNNKKINKNNHPKNSFLEELNKEKNINKIFDRIKWKYISYYSNITWNNGLNNIVWYKLNNENDSTEMTNWKDIYDKYYKKINKNIYNIDEIIRDDKWKWWDWTVPTLNLRLVPNDSRVWKEIVNNKFRSQEIKCKYNSIYKNIWFGDNEICSHANMPIATAYKVLKDVLWKRSSYRIKKHRVSLLYNLWYTNYNSEVMDNNFNNRNFISVKNKNIDWKFKYSLKLGSNLNLMSYEILSPINVIIKDSKWRRIWINPETWKIINEIPWAFTSWNTYWSDKREIFFVPIWKNEKHIIKTYWTWDWEYHIVYNKITNNYTGNVWTWNIIAWVAKKSFWEDYIVEKKWDIISSKNITANITTKIDIGNFKIETSDINYSLRYFIRWNNKNIFKIKYSLTYDNSLIDEQILEITWKIDLILWKIWKYKLKIDLLDNNLSKIWNIESTKNIIIIKNDKMKKNEKELIKESILNNKINIDFEKQYYKKIQEIEKSIKKMSFHTKNRLKIYIEENKGNILNKIKNNSIKKRYNFFLNKIVEIIIDNN